MTLTDSRHPKALEVGSWKLEMQTITQRAGWFQET